MAGRQDLRISQGDDYSKTIAVFADDGSPAVLTTDGTLTGAAYTASAQLRRDYADSDGTVDASFGCTVQPVGSRVTISLNAATTAGLTNGPYKWDLQITNPSTSVKSTIARGTAYVSLEVTRP